MHQRAFFAIETPDGVKYTRNGQFQLDDAGTLRTSEGFGVLGLKGVITGLSPKFLVKPNGTISDKNTDIDRLQIINPPANTLKREGQSLYSAIGTPVSATNINVLQGSLENSNVDLAGQMEKMIIVMRAYEANQRVIQTQDSTLEKAVNEVGKL